MKIRKSTLTYAALLSVAMFLLTVNPVAAELLDRIVATVNGEVITLSELNAKADPLIAASGVTDPGEQQAMRAEILDAMIDQIITIQEGTRKGVVVSEEELQAAIGQILQSNNITQAELSQKLHEQGSTFEQFLQNLHIDILRSKLIDLEVRSRIVITDEEIDAYLRAQGASMVTVSSDSGGVDDSLVRVSNIFFQIPAGAGEEAVRSIMARAEKVRAEIQGGLAFASAAAMYSEASNAEQGGDMGQIAWSDMNEQLRSELRALSSGQVSRPVILGSGINLFMISSHVVATVSEGDEQLGTPEERERVKNMLADERLQRKFNEYVGGLREQATIKITL